MSNKRLLQVVTTGLGLIPVVTGAADHGIALLASRQQEP
jgi:hypothetical protein